MVYGSYNELVTGANLNQHSHNWGASHCRNDSECNMASWEIGNPEVDGYWHAKVLKEMSVFPPANHIWSPEGQTNTCQTRKGVYTGDIMGIFDGDIMWI